MEADDIPVDDENDTRACPDCDATGYDDEDGSPCGRCGGLGYIEATAGVPASGLTQQLARAVEASDEGHDPLCMAILRGKDCTCGLDERNAGVDVAPARNSCTFPNCKGGECCMNPSNARGVEGPDCG